MITISNKISGFCCICDKEKEDARQVSLVDKFRNRFTSIYLCERHLKQLGDAINTLFEDETIVKRIPHSHGSNTQWT